MRQGLSGPDLRNVADARVTLGLGTGAIGNLGAPDMLLEARLNHLLAEQMGTAPSAFQSLQRATLGGARARGLDAHTGSLVAGKAAERRAGRHAQDR